MAQGRLTPRAGCPLCRAGGWVPGGRGPTGRQLELMQERNRAGGGVREDKGINHFRQPETRPWLASWGRGGGARAGQGPGPALMGSGSPRTRLPHSAAALRPQGGFPEQERSGWVMEREGGRTDGHRTDGVRHRVAQETGILGHARARPLRAKGRDGGRGTQEKPRRGVPGAHVERDTQGAPETHTGTDTGRRAQDPGGPTHRGRRPRDAG